MFTFGGLLFAWAETGNNHTSAENESERRDEEPKAWDHAGAGDDKNTNQRFKQHRQGTMTKFFDNDVLEPSTGEGFSEIEDKAINADEEDAGRNGKETEQEEHGEERNDNYEANAEHEVNAKALNGCLSSNTLLRAREDEEDDGDREEKSDDAHHFGQPNLTSSSSAAGRSISLELAVFNICRY